MDKYTDLQQAEQDQMLAVITDTVDSLDELNKIYLKYKVLPRKWKRFSNYYSCKFLGHTVPEMFDLKKNKLLNETGILEDLQLPAETYVISEPDLYYKEADFNAGKTNICFILGHSGSGKSVMARTLEGNDIDHIELDDLLLIKDHFSKDELKDYSDMFSSFFDGEGGKYYIGAQERDDIPKEEYEDRVFIDFVRFAMNYASQHKDKKYIIDGIWIYLYFEDPSVFDDYAVFIKGTSFLKSKIRTMKRELQRDVEVIQERKEMFGREVRNYLLDEEKIDSYRDYFGNKQETVFREENSEAMQKEAMVINELNKIDEFFVEEDEDGIDTILKNAEANTEFTALDKLRIINECQAALLDLRLEQEQQKIAVALGQKK